MSVSPGNTFDQFEQSTDQNLRIAGKLMPFYIEETLVAEQYAGVEGARPLNKNDTLIVDSAHQVVALDFATLISSSSEASALKYQLIYYKYNETYHKLACYNPDTHPNLNFNNYYSSTGSSYAPGVPIGTYLGDGSTLVKHFTASIDWEKFISGEAESPEALYKYDTIIKNRTITSWGQSGGVDADFMPDIDNKIWGYEKTYQIPSNRKVIGFYLISSGGGGGATGSGVLDTYSWAAGGGEGGWCYGLINLDEVGTEEIKFTIGESGARGSAGGNSGATGGAAKLSIGGQTIIEISGGGGGGGTHAKAVGTGGTGGKLITNNADDVKVTILASGNGYNGNDGIKTNSIFTTKATAALTVNYGLSPTLVGNYHYTSTIDPLEGVEVYEYSRGGYGHFGISSGSTNELMRLNGSTRIHGNVEGWGYGYGGSGGWVKSWGNSDAKQVGAHGGPGTVILLWDQNPLTL